MMSTELLDILGQLVATLDIMAGLDIVNSYLLFLVYEIFILDPGPLCVMRSMLVLINYLTENVECHCWWRG